MSGTDADSFGVDVSAWRAAPTSRGLFVVGVGPKVGATLIAGAIARCVRLRGRRVEVFRPIATGCYRNRGQLVSSEAEFLAACADSRLSLPEIAPVRFATRVAANVASRREGRPVDPQAILDAYARAAAQAEMVVVDGGEMMAPIDEAFRMVHLARWTALGVLVVADTRPGAMNYTLLTIQAARSAGLTVTGVVLNRYRLEDEGGDIEMATYRSQIASLARTEVLAVVPEEEANSVERSAVGPDTEFAIAQVLWEDLAPPRRR